MSTTINSIPLSTKLFYLITISDGKIDNTEIEMGNKMINLEGLCKEKFDADLQQLEKNSVNQLLEECIHELSNLNKMGQINWVAWGCLIANADGFMDDNEWPLIYEIYHKHLKLQLTEIMVRQKELNNRMRQYNSTNAKVNQN